MGITIQKTGNRFKLISLDGFVPPQLTTTERNAISSPENGLLIYNTTDSQLQIYISSWQAVGSGGGSSTRTVVSKAVGDSPYSANIDEDVLVDASGGDVTINLPTAVGNTGQSIFVKKQDSSGNDVIIDGNSTETIDGQLTLTINVQYDGYELMSNGTNWYIR